MKIAVISAILENANESQNEFNRIVAQFRGNIRGRMGIPFTEGVSVITITVTGELDDINSITGKIGKIPGVSVKTAISKKEL